MDYFVRNPARRVEPSAVVSATAKHWPDACGVRQFAIHCCATGSYRNAVAPVLGTVVAAPVASPFAHETGVTAIDPCRTAASVIAAPRAVAVNFSGTVGPPLITVTAPAPDATGDANPVSVHGAIVTVRVTSGAGL